MLSSLEMVDTHPQIVYSCMVIGKLPS